MSDTTLKVAKKCPKCNQTGELVKEGPTTDPEYTAYIYQCTRQLCVWFNTTWVVTADADGVVPVMDVGHTKKIFPARPDITPEQLERLRTTFDDEV